MTDEPPTTDGGTPAPAERDVRRAGERPPDVPTRTTVEDLLPRLLDDAEEVTTGYHIRARLDGDDPDRAAEQLVEALQRKVSVVGTTLDAGVDPEDPQLDVLIECDHTMSQVATALARVAPVDGAVVLDVTEECEHILEEQAEGEAADAADANDVFSELQQQVSEADYDQVVDELKDVSFPGGPDPNEEVDLEETAGVELSDDESKAEAEAEAGGDGTRAIDLEDGDGMETDSVSAADLFGEAGSDAETTPSESNVGAGADETAIEEAVQNIEADDDGDAVPAGDSATDGTEVDEPAGDAADPEPETTAGPEPAPDEPAADAEKVAADGAAEEPDDTAADPGTTAARPDAASVDATVDALVDALESGEVGPDRRQRLREALGIESTHSIDVRLEYLQKRVDNLAAYNDAWEAFLSEEGTGDKFIEEVRQRLDALEEEVAAADGSPPGELVGRVDELEATIEELDAQGGLAEVEERLDEIERRHEELAEQHEADISRIESRLETFGDAIEKLKESLQQFADWRERVNDVLRG